MSKKTTLRQQEIIDSARRIIIEKGIDHLTVREIAEDLAITNGALYRHFRSKREIISLLIDDIEATLLATINQAAAGSADPLRKLQDIFHSHLTYAERRKGVSFIVISNTLGTQDPYLQKKMFGVIKKYLSTIKIILKAGISSGKFRKGLNTDSSGIAFLGMIQSLVTLWSLSRYKYAFKRVLLDDMFDLYKAGIITK